MSEPVKLCVYCRLLPRHRDQRWCNPCQSYYYRTRTPRPPRLFSVPFTVEDLERLRVRLNLPTIQDVLTVAKDYAHD